VHALGEFDRQVVADRGGQQAQLLSLEQLELRAASPTSTKASPPLTSTTRIVAFSSDGTLPIERPFYGPSTVVRPIAERFADWKTKQKPGDQRAEPRFSLTPGARKERPKRAFHACLAASAR
jgi:hypothetical protein